MYQINNLLSHDECDRIVRISKEFIKGQYDIDSNEGVRVSIMSTRLVPDLLQKDDSDFVKEIGERISKVAGLDGNGDEFLSVSLYRDGRGYGYHWDDRVNGFNPPRLATVVVYLNDVDIDNGATIFPLLDKDLKNKYNHDMIMMAPNIYKACKSNDWIRVAPKKGSATLFYNYILKSDQVYPFSSLKRSDFLGVDENLLHAGCPVTEGEKWIIQLWIRSNQYPRKQVSEIKVDVNRRGILETKPWSCIHTNN
jgi:prolyl 4-hydroxylase